MTDHASFISDIAADDPGASPPDNTMIYGIAAMLALGLESQSPTLHSAVTALRDALTWDDKIARLSDLKQLLIIEYGMATVEQAPLTMRAQHLGRAQEMLWERYDLYREPVVE